jgi:ABC-type Zn uptake system ZnuABC Zn-binding protein ZnuA
MNSGGSAMRRPWISGARIALILGVAAISGCHGGADGWAERPGPKVLAFFPPLYSLAASIAGDDAQVQSLLKSKGPHDYEPQPSDARKLRRADLFLTIGLGLDDQVAKKLAATCGNPKLKVVELGEGLPKEMLREGTCTCGHEHEKNAEHEHDHGFDPHVWMGIPEAIVMVDAIGVELSKFDPSHAAGYQQRAEALKARLTALQTEGKALLETKKEKARLLTHHDSLHYFARSFGAEIVDAIELPGREPSGKRLNQLVEICKEKNVRLIAVEPQYSANSGAQAVLRELRLKGVADPEFVELDPLETADRADLTPDFYERRMRANLDNLAKALK